MNRELKKIFLGPFRIWQPSKSQPLDIENTIGDYVRFLKKNYHVSSIHVDPYQLHQLITELKKEGIPIEEFPQTSGNLTQATQNLYELLVQRNIVLSDDKKLAAQSENAVAIESGRGMKLAKEKSSRKIDAIVALSFATLFAVENMNRVGAVSFTIRTKPEFVRASQLSIYEREKKRWERLARFREAGNRHRRL